MNYKKLLKKAQKEYDAFSLVWRDQFEFDENCRLIESELEPFLIKEERTDEWPGTKIYGALATVRHYKVENGSIKILSRIDHFTGWIAPSYPEDLAFYKGNDVIYTSIAHEDDEWFNEKA